MVVFPYCLAPHCKSRVTTLKKCHGITFHSFPVANQRKVLVETEDGSRELMDRRQAWIKILKITKPLAKHAKVCSLHFKKEDYFPTGTRGRRNLKRNTVPSQNLSQAPVILKSKSNTSIKECYKTETKQVLRECKGFQNVIQKNNSPHDLEAARALLKLFEAQPDANVDVLRNISEARVKRTSKCSQSVEEVGEVRKIRTLYEFMKKDETLEYFTSLRNFDILNKIIELVQKDSNDVDCQEVNIAEKIILVLAKMKLNYDFIALSLLFNISVDLCEKYFYQMLKILGNVLKPTIGFEKECTGELFGVLKYFEGVCTILDFVEILIQEPTCDCCQTSFFSETKSHTTVKFMIARSVDMTITYVSEPFGGKASNRSIFRHCDMISNSDIDGIITKEDFDIKDLCEAREIELLRPKFPFAKEKLLNVEIITALSNNEENNKKLWNFRILNQELKWELVPFIEDIFIVACGVTNLSHSGCSSK